MSSLTASEIEESLHQYINENATFESLRRAANRFPRYDSNENNIFHFKCSGAQNSVYKVTIDLNNLQNIKSRCSCPYSKKGICKHIVASILQLIGFSSETGLELDGIDYNKNAPSSSTLTKIAHKDRVIDVIALKKVEFYTPSHYYNYNPFHFVTVLPTKVVATIDTYNELYKITLNYNKNSDEITLDCTCDSRRPCVHKKRFLEKMIKYYGEDYFSPKFREGIKHQVMEKSQYKGALDFDDVYTLEITTDGIEVKEKISNLVSLDDTTIQLFNTNYKDLFIPKATTNKSAYGMGFCIERLQNEAMGIYLFYGKMDKSKIKLSTKFRVIDEVNFTEVLSIMDDKESHAIITKGIQLSEIFDENNYTGYDLEGVKNMIQVASSLFEMGLSSSTFLYNKQKSFVKKNLDPLVIKEDEIVPILKITDNKPFYQLTFKVKIGNKKLSISSKKLIVTPIGLIVDNIFYIIKNASVAYALLKAKNRPHMHLINDGIEQLRSNVIEPFSKIFEIDFPKLKESKQKQKIESIEKHVYLSDEEGEYVVLRPLVKYGKDLVSPGSMEKVWKDKSKLSYFKRNEDLEKNFLSDFTALHPHFEAQSNYFYLTVEEALKSMWLMEAIEKLKEKNIRVFGLNNLKTIQYNLNKPTFSLGLSSGTDWFDMNIKVDFGGQKVDLKQIQKAILKQSNYIELKDGTIGILPKEWINKYKKYFKVGQVKKDRIEISNFQFNIIDELYEEQTNTPKFLEELYEKKKRLTNLSDLKTIRKPKGLKATLRPYQKEGLNWLAFLHENKLGGCLADDMGLGKTIQTIAFMLYLKNKSTKKSDLPHLVIAPTTLVFNWMAELEKFAPTLRVLSYIGPTRSELTPEITKNDVVLTTYGSLIKDIEKHREIDYNYIVLDESQAIKNPQSQRFKAVRLLKGVNRLALTGTPIENNTFDLYSQFNFLNPGIFGSIKHFRTTFSDAIDKEQDEDTSDLLARMIHPFILRRTKDQVAKELPSKTEAIIYCEMGKEQRKVYDHFKAYYRQKLQEQIEDEGVNKSQMYILQGLTKLRQICNSSALADKEKDFGNSSAKLDELIRHITEKVNNHKILVFSQFVGMLHIVKERLEQEGIVFEYLDGKTRKREEKVNNFQNNDEIRVFLISLKAGGTGLNLTEAQYVYLIDPWWNPAVESQAIDRCYRIGQDKKVMAYRMICKDTIEDKIVQLQDKKKTIASDVIRVDKEKKSFNKKDVALFFGDS